MERGKIAFTVTICAAGIAAATPTANRQRAHVGVAVLKIISNFHTYISPLPFLHRWNFPARAAMSGAPPRYSFRRPLQCHQAQFGPWQASRLPGPFGVQACLGLVGPDSAQVVGEDSSQDPAYVDHTAACGHVVDRWAGAGRLVP